MRRLKRRNQRGASIAEFAAVLVFGGPLLILLIYVALETAHFYTIKSAMELGARNAARALVVNYNRTSSEADNSFLSSLTIPNYIASTSQYTVVWDTSSPPQYVTVSCAYPAGGGNGLTPFPAGPLRYLNQNAQFDLGSFTVRGTFTFPVQ